MHFLQLTCRVFPIQIFQDSLKPVDDIFIQEDFVIRDGQYYKHNKILEKLYDNNMNRISSQ